MDVSEKTVITVETETGTEEKPLNDARRKSQVLKELQVNDLASMARRIENFPDLLFCLERYCVERFF
jgi:hypothetical protein